MKPVVELDLELVYTTDDAYRVYDGDTYYWVPKSLVEDVEELDNKGNCCFTIQEWFAIKEGMV